MQGIPGSVDLTLEPADPQDAIYDDHAPPAVQATATVRSASGELLVDYPVTFYFAQGDNQLQKPVSEVTDENGVAPMPLYNPDLYTGEAKVKAVVQGIAPQEKNGRLQCADM